MSRTISAIIFCVTFQILSSIAGPESQREMLYPVHFKTLLLTSKVETLGASNCITTNVRRMCWVRTPGISFANFYNYSETVETLRLDYLTSVRG